MGVFPPYEGGIKRGLYINDITIPNLPLPLLRKEGEQIYQQTFVAMKQ